MELKENIFFNLFSETAEFYSIGGDSRTLPYNYVLNDESFIAIFFSLSQKYEQYERTVFTLFDMFGMIGGIFEIFSILGFVLVGSLSSNYFSNSLLATLYHVNEQVDDTKVAPI